MKTCDTYDEVEEFVKSLEKYVFLNPGIQYRLEVKDHEFFITSQDADYTDTHKIIKLDTEEDRLIVYTKHYTIPLLEKSIITTVPIWSEEI